MVSPIKLVFFSRTHYYTDSPYEILHTNYFRAIKKNPLLTLVPIIPKKRECYPAFLHFRETNATQLFTACKSNINRKSNNKSNSKSFFLAFILFFFSYRNHHIHTIIYQQNSGNDHKRKIHVASLVPKIAIFSLAARLCVQKCGSIPFVKKVFNRRTKKPWSL